MLAPFDQGDDDVPGIAPGLVVTEDMAALEFARKWGGRLAYCHDHGKWFEYDGNIWRVCKTPVAFHYARELCRRLSFSALAGAQLQKTRFAAGVEQFARADPTFARTAEFWDQDIWTLGTPDGTVDLRTGRIRPAVQSEHITKSTAVSPDLFEDCPAWTTFLEQATGGDESMMRFMQQIAGMALTGDISEQSLFFIWGPGGNGKGTFIHTIESILGDYAEDAAMDSFTAHRSSQHPTDLASLRGARLVTASETESGAAWN
jgi:putative DNA primase/helicase